MCEWCVGSKHAMDDACLSTARKVGGLSRRETFERTSTLVIVRNLPKAGVSKLFTGVARTEARVLPCRAREKTRYKWREDEFRQF